MGDEDGDTPGKGKQTLAAKQKKQLEKLMAHPVRARNMIMLFMVKIL